MSETSISLFPEFLDPDYPQSVENESRNDLADTIRSTLDPVFRDIRKALDLAEEQADWTGHEGDYLSLIDRARMALGTMAASCWYGMLDENNPYIRKDVGILRGVLQAAAAHKDGLIRYLDRQVEAYDKQSRLPVTRGENPPQSWRGSWQRETGSSGASTLSLTCCVTWRDTARPAATKCSMSSTHPRTG